MMKNQKFFSRLGEKLSVVLFPNRCSCCLKVIPEKVKICDNCKASLEKLQIEEPLCSDFSKNLHGTFFRTHDFDRLYVAYYYDGAIKTGLQNLKFHENPHSADFFAECLINKFGENICKFKPDLICFIPLSKTSLKNRGYNQSKLIAEKTAEHFEIDFSDSALKKIIETKTQHSQKGFMRFGNVFGVYDATKEVEKKRILLIDDIVTTGATLSECAKMLKLYGADEVAAMAVAAPYPPKKEKATK